jgi:hypothetical protein
MDPFYSRSVRHHTEGPEITYVASPNKFQLNRAFDVLFNATLPDWNDHLDEIDSTKPVGSGYTTNVLL